MLDELATPLTMLLIARRLFLAILVAVALVSSVLDLYASSQSKFVACFSISRNAPELFKVDKSRSTAVDTMKLCFALFFVSMHAVSGIDNPFGPVVISKC